MAKKAEKVFSIPQVQKIGIYAIHNKANGKFYIGSSVNVYNRMLTHARSILRNGGINIHMAKDLKKKDYKNLEFIVLKTYDNGTITDAQLRNEEWETIKKYDSFENGYNKAWTHGNGVFKENEFLECKPVKSSGGNYDRAAVNLPKGTKEKIKELTGESCNAYISALVLENLEQLESRTGTQAANADSCPFE